MMEAGPSARADRILDAAASLIVHYGYDKTTVSDIAREAGVSKGAIYLHWESKEDLFEALLAREAIRLLDDVEARIDADPEGGTVPAIYRHGLEAMSGRPFMRALYTRDARVLGERYMRASSPRPIQRRAHRFLFGQEYVRQMQDAGLLRGDLSPKMITFLISILSYGLFTIRTIIPGEESPPVEETFSAMAELIRLALVPPSGGDSERGKQALKKYFKEIRAQFEDVVSPPATSR